MQEKHLANLEKVGLSTAEAQIYLALVRRGAPMGASAVVAATGVPRSSVYPTLTRLTDMGLVEAEAGYGGRFSPVPAEQALPSLITREREELSQREQIAGELTKELKSLGEAAESNGESELIQVLRDPRVIGQRFERLQLEAKRQVDIMVRAPILNPRRDNPAQAKAQRRGIRFRCLYESAAIEDAEIKPYLEGWIAAGEEARVYDGKLPHKVAIFDAEVVLLPLIMAGEQMRALFIRHQELAEGLSMLFEFLWQQSESISPIGGKKTIRPAKSVDRKRKQFIGSNSNH